MTLFKGLSIKGLRWPTLSKRDTKPKTPETPPLVITEGIAGYWHYHLSRDKISRGLCGAQTMYTAIPLEHWGKPFGEHFPKRPTWCKACQKHL